MDNTLPDNTRHISLCETLDRVLNKGAVVTGEITISVANIDLIYLGLRLLVSSVETARSYCSSPIHRGYSPPINWGTTRRTDAD